MLPHFGGYCDSDWMIELGERASERVSNCCCDMVRVFIVGGPGIIQRPDSTAEQKYCC